MSCHLRRVDTGAPLPYRFERLERAEEIRDDLEVALRVPLEIVDGPAPIASSDLERTLR